MNPYALLSFLAAFFSLLSAIYVIRKNPRSSTNRIFSLTTLCLFIWGLGEGMHRAAATPSEAMFWIRYVEGLGSSFFAPLILHFWLVFSGETKHFKRIPIHLIYIPAFIFISIRLAFPELFLKGVVLEWWGYSTIGTPIYKMFLVYVAMYTITTFILSLRTYFKARGKMRNHAKYISFSIVPFIIAGIGTQVTAPILGAKVLELSIISTPLFVFFITYAVVKHGLMSITPPMAANKIIETMQDYLIVIDREKRIEIINQSALSALGYKKEELKGRFLETVLSEKISSLTFRDLAKKAPLRRQESEILTKDNKKTKVSINGSLVTDKKGANIGFVFIMRDTTETDNFITTLEQKTKELNEKVKEITATKTAVLNMMEDADIINREFVEAQGKLKSSLEEMELVDVKKDEFISVAAHELKTPLTAIHGFSQLLQNEKVFRNKKKRDGYLKLMDKETKRLTGMVTDILELSRIDLGTIKLTKEKVSLGEIYDTVKKEMTLLAQDKGLKTRWSMVKKISDIVTDKEKVIQVLINLVNNAIKYTEKGSITIDMIKEKDFVRFDIKDTGIGIPEEQFDKIFERFYQIDSSYTRKTKGTGLGLALCKEYVELLGGRIWLESQTGKGTTFHFTLPLKDSGKHASEVEKRARERLEDSRALVKRIGLRGEPG